jgi:tripeptide aminopeptidase
MIARAALTVLAGLAVLASGPTVAEDSLFSPKIAGSSMVREAFDFLERNRPAIVAEWMALAEIPAPSGKEAARAAVMKKKLAAAGLSDVRIDPAGNVVGVWPGSGPGKRIVLSAHMDTVFRGVTSIKAKRVGGRLKAPGIGDDTASLIDLLWTIRALKAAGFAPVNTYDIVATVSEESGFVGMRAFLDRPPAPIDMLIALDDDLGKVHYGALGIGGGTITFRGPGAHTMQSRGVADPNLAAALAVVRLKALSLPAEPVERWTVLNVGTVWGGTVPNAMSQETSLSVDLRSADQGELDRGRKEIARIAREAAAETGTTVEIALSEEARAVQLAGAHDSALVRTLTDILRFLAVKDIAVDPLGSTEANAGLERGILSVNAGRTYGTFKHSLNEDADIEGLYVAQRQLVLLLACLR